MTVRRVLVYIQVTRLRSANTSTRLTKLNKPKNKLKNSKGKTRDGVCLEKAGDIPSSAD